MKAAATKAVQKIEASQEPLTEAEAFGHVRYCRNRMKAISEALNSGRIRQDRSHYRNGSGSPKFTINAYCTTGDEQKEECLRCGTELHTELDFQTGICANCWTPEDEQ